MNKQSWKTYRFICLFSVAVCLTGGLGCQIVPKPFEDEFVGRPVVTTPSAEVARHASAPRSSMARDFAVTRVPVQDGTVLHLPLYFEDPFEDNGSEDGRFAWTGEDYFQFLYWRGRFLVNAVAFPISAAVTPPWVVMASDGRQGRRILWEDHDATRWQE